MSTGKHYFIEETRRGFAIRAKKSKRASVIVATQSEAMDRVKHYNPEDHPDIERVRNVRTGGRDKWRPGGGHGSK